MSFILALETATTSCSAALCAADGSVVAESLTREGPAHAQNLLTGVHKVMTEAKVGWDDIDTIAVGLGPGAFTGLRIGIATARALAQADGRVRLAGVPTTTALALRLARSVEAGSRLLVPLVDGRRHEVFAAVFEGSPRAGTFAAAREVTVVGADDLSEWLADLGPSLTGGDGAQLYGDRLPSSAVHAVDVPGPTAALIGSAVAIGVAGVVWGPDAVLPLYGRVPDAARWVAPAHPPTVSAG